MDLFTTLEQCATLPQPEGSSHRQHIDDATDQEIKAIYENLLYLSVAEATEYLEYEQRKCSSIQKSELLQKMVQQFQDFKIIYSRYLETLNMHNRAIAVDANMCELLIKDMQQDGLTFIKYIITTVGMQYQFTNNANRGWLHFATIWRNEKLIQWLLSESYKQTFSNNSLINKQDDNGHTALDEAVLLGVTYNSIAKILRSNGGVHGTRRPSMMEILVHHWTE
jgi:hypothetical protein